ncbi:MAG: DegT/DnrJ/EryC1/StrS family aminotransferase [Anaerolineae bacterium]|uniref:DegT/DnrJ/EryC1/StrS family aminotransferase n=1 Tax=Candidatus Amarolinea dominans TaxID=3140696 RepID=UPI003136F1B3|nr:DegT/DnrJ/EryC1/StrS family aminotransferase [Anaerolineae bacterium]
MPEAPWGRGTRWLTVITVDPAQFGATREDIRLALEDENIESRPLWKPMHLQPVFAGCEVVGGDVAAALFQHGLCLPSGTAMSETDLERVAAVIQSLRR